MQLTKREQRLIRQAKREVIRDLVAGALLIGTYLAGFAIMMMR